jgi:protein-L-isoaspartate(D-aspartate) O-methyltransferase
MNTQARQGIGMTSQRTRERLISRLVAQGISDERVLDAMRTVPRHLFVDEALASRAYEDTALPIGSGQTISQPYVVARMTAALMEVSPRKVLEVGSGCGYQTVILSLLIPEVFSIERLAALHHKAKRHLAELHVTNVRLRHDDGYRGWPAAAPFDAILVTAAPPEVPEALLKQLAEGGRLIIPVGGGSEQELRVITRSGNQFHHQVLERVVFVPMLSGADV